MAALLNCSTIFLIGLFMNSPCILKVLLKAGVLPFFSYISTGDGRGNTHIFIRQGYHC